MEGVGILVENQRTSNFGPRASVPGHMRTSVARNQEQSLSVIIGGSMLMIGWVMFGAANYVSDFGTEHQALYGQLLLVAAFLQTVGAMIIAASDINIDLFAKRHPVCVLTFVLSWTVPYEGLQALVLPIAPANQVHWIPTLPLVYLLLRFQAVLQMESEHDGTRSSDLFAYSLS